MFLGHLLIQIEATSRGLGAKLSAKRSEMGAAIENFLRAVFL
jgi:hypothetical protein